MKMDKKQAYVHQAKRKRKSEKDIPIKHKIINLIHDRFGLIGLTSEVIPIPDRKPINYHRMPDILIPQRNIVIELDGPIHGYGDGISKREDDIQRDQDYKDAGYKLIIVNQELTNGYELEKVFDVLQKEGICN